MHARSLLLASAVVSLSACRIETLDRQPGGEIQLSDQHETAVNRHRYVILNFDVMIVDLQPGQDARQLARNRLAFVDDPKTRINSILWNWGEGNVVPYPSKFLLRLF